MSADKSAFYSLSYLSDRFENNLRDGVVGRVRHRKMNFVGAHVFQQIARFAFDFERRHALRVV